MVEGGVRALGVLAVCDAKLCTQTSLGVTGRGECKGGVGESCCTLCCISKKSREDTDTAAYEALCANMLLKSCMRWL